MHLPGPIRAAVGLAASAADEARNLPDRALELPMVVVGSALQLSLRAQQRYAMLAARGDEVINGRATGDEPPAWATFDDDPASPADAAVNGAAERMIDDLFGVDDPSSTDDGDDSRSTVTPIAKATGRNAAKRSADRRTSAKKTPAKKAVAKKAPARKAETATEPDDGDAGKTVSKPRHTAPSKFDDASDD